MIEARALSKSYGDHLALDRATFNAKRGEIVGLLGANGAGKTTTMRLLTGFMPPNGGTAHIAGFDVQTHSLEVRQRVGYLPERVPLYPDMSAEEYVLFWARLRNAKNPKAQTQRVLERVNLQDRRRTLIRNLSKGMRQRLGLAQALVHNPPVIILDEPTIGIDPQQVIEVRQLIRALAAEHTVLFSTHILSEAEQVCDRVVILHHGRVIAQGEPSSLRQQLQPGQHLFVQIARADDASARHLLESLPAVESVTTQGDGYHLRASAGADLRAVVAEHVIAAGYQLLELRPVAMTLEDIFLDVLGKENDA